MAEGRLSFRLRAQKISLGSSRCGFSEFTKGTMQAAHVYTRLLTCTHRIGGFDFRFDRRVDVGCAVGGPRSRWPAWAGRAAMRVGNEARAGAAARFAAPDGTRTR
jgi:hypothetical protein